MKIVIESPEKLTDSDLEEIVDVWNRLLCKLSCRLLSHDICILSLLMHFVKHLSTSIMHFNNTISKGRQKGSKGGSPCPPPSPHLYETLSSPLYVTLLPQPCVPSRVYLSYIPSLALYALPSILSPIYLALCIHVPSPRYLAYIHAPSPRYLAYIHVPSPIYLAYIHVPSPIYLALYIHVPSPIYLAYIHVPSPINLAYIPSLYTCT